MVHHTKTDLKPAKSKTLTTNTDYAKVGAGMTKQKNTKKISYSRLTPLIAGAVIVVSGLMGPFVSVSADSFDDQIRQKQAQQSAAQAQANKLGAKANTIEGQINDLQIQIATIQAKIEGNVKRKDDLSKKIQAAQKRLEEQKDLLSANIRSMYIEGDITPLEMLASSKNLGDFVDKQEYRDRIKENITNTLDEIEKLKKQLDEQRQEIVKIIEEQKSLRGDLRDKEGEASQKLASVQQTKASFDKQVQKMANEIASLQAQQAAAYAAATGGGSRNYGSLGSFEFRNLSAQQYCGGGYSYCNAAHDQYVDDTWGLHLARECVHYAADRAARGVNLAPYLGGGRGYAYMWPNSLKTRYKVNQTPSVGAVAIAPASGSMPVGHAMYVEYITSDGWVGVSQMNFDVQGSYSTMEIKPSGVWFIHM
jgi:peptidoglycan hydrolase CwlO-like protein